MKNDRFTISRRGFLQYLGGLGASLVLTPVPAVTGAPITKPVPSSGERLPVIGMGSWMTFNVGSNVQELAVRVQVLQTFFDMGGALIDSSPMYLSSEEVIGYCLQHIKNKNALFAATKVWTRGRRGGINQMAASRKKWGIERFDLMQIHNMLDWETHLETLQAWKAQGRIRYLGMTTSHGRRHGAFLQAMQEVSFDFVQFTYNILDREAEQYLLPLAAERGQAVIINRPFRRGDLFDYVKGKSLPAWAQEFDCHNWAQFFLKFIVSHPAVTCVIPATSRVDHMQENMGAGYGRLPDVGTRQKMIRYFESII